MLDRQIPVLPFIPRNEMQFRDTALDYSQCLITSITLTVCTKRVKIHLQENTQQKTS